MTAEQKVARAAHKAASALEGLAAAMKEAHAEGVSLRKIAASAGMSHESVRRIVAS